MGQDTKYMAQSLALAARAGGRTCPNPMVGAVLVNNGKIVGQGYHQKAGMPHAEIEALAQAGEQAKGATLYVTLEPCNHHGRTPPCTEAIIRAGIKKVVYATEDPNPVVSGGGHKTLTENGIETIGGVMEKEAVKLNEVYFKYMKSGLPFVTLKLAVSLDGRIAMSQGTTTSLSGDEARRYVHSLRLAHEAVMVGANTVVADDPQLTVRLVDNPESKQPTRFITDGKLSLSLDSKVLTDGQAKTIVVTTSAADQDKKKKIEAKGIDVWTIGKDAKGYVDLKALLHQMGLDEYCSLLVEGGGKLAASFLKLGLVDKIAMIYTPNIIGAQGVAAVGELEITELKDAFKLRDMDCRMLGQDVLIEGYLVK
ncbi:bifunctional diaminohydroxyphosphoribosylaminopyrimidine deaminase/5-amino-6-(5-phosphoribosylamino)uracil reductase RibD [candidate division TA06 bacterium]|uniref:Riboflavin biosynthesis protein RibD n=1 Tax=candidate division TA06 bacterium TaxID=2250710 RepID=A0A933IB45_UNCT6|nr:bifunctional diaminohydroxyphosphoribosylaminopyrimidine deaminase/5-amino-6-(5-phosphoribosylamino)uracil reductase RibD [candidate division TA06 bacterium]